MFQRPPVLLLAILCLFGISGEAAAACTDPAQAGVNWRRCYHDGRNLARVNLTNAELRDATFQRSILDYSVMIGADAFRAKFISARMIGVVLDEARLIEADMTKANLTGASFRDADLRNARLVEAVLRDADLTGARLAGADLRQAELSGAIWIDGERVCAEGSIGQCN